MRLQCAHILSTKINYNLQAYHRHRSPIVTPQKRHILRSIQPEQLKRTRLYIRYVIALYLKYRLNISFNCSVFKYKCMTTPTIWAKVTPVVVTAWRSQRSHYFACIRSTYLRRLETPTFFYTNPLKKCIKKWNTATTKHVPLDLISFSLYNFSSC